MSKTVLPEDVETTRWRCKAEEQHDRADKLEQVLRDWGKLTSSDIETIEKGIGTWGPAKKT